MLNDLRYALRSLSKSKGFVVLVVVSLSISLGLLTTMYAMIDAAMFPYIAYREPDQLFSVSYRGDPRQQRVKAHEMSTIVRSADVFADAAAMAGWGSYVRVSPEFFRVIGIQPLFGRTFNPDGSDPGDDNVVVISYEYWKGRFLGRRELDSMYIGTAENPVPVLGVMPRGANVSSPAWSAIDIWRLIPPAALASGRGLGFLRTIVRLKPGVTPDSARVVLKHLEARATNQFGTPLAFEMVSVRPDPFDLDDKHAILAGAAVVILLIACANLANLMLARGLRRRRELALRRALGASRAALVRQLLAESIVLAAIGGALGTVAAAWGMDLLVSRMPAEVTFGGRIHFQLSWRMFVFALLSASTAVLLSGLWPAIQTSGVDLNEPLKEGSGTTTGRVRLRYSPLVMAQVALSMILLLSAGIMVEVVRRVAGFDFGYDHRGLYTTWVPSPRGVPSTTLQHIVARVAQLPGVDGAATMWGARTSGGQILSDLPSDTAIRVTMFGYSIVSSDFFRIMGVPVIQGRDFEPGDAATDSGAVIVNERAARLLWPNLDPVGRRVKLGADSSSRPWLRVVGVVRRAELSFQSDPWLPPRPEVYVVSAADSVFRPGIVFRAAGATTDQLQAVAREVQSIASLPTAPGVAAWFAYHDSAVASRSFLAGLFVAFGAFALLLAVMGLYAVLNYAVTQRLREFAVRVALGATSGNVFRLVLHDGMVMLLAGTAVGAFLAMAAGNLLGEWLYNVNPANVRLLLAAEFTLFVASLLAILGPARRATRASPVEILRAV